MLQDGHTGRQEEHLTSVVSTSDMAIQDRIFGKPLATSEERAEQIGVGAGIPIFGLDALTSAAYGPEAALALLIPLGMVGTQYLLPIITSILILLVIVYFSYRQTIAAYPHGGGSYTVATENLGERAGLLAAAALMIDYILTAAVGISAGVTALTSALPELQPHTLALCLLILAILAIVNLRGVKDTGTAFIVPTFLFIGTLLTLIAVGVYKTFAAGGHPLPVTAMPAPLPQTVQYLGLWMLLKAFSSGCAAMTGVEAVSNGVMAFREPRAKNAQYALTVIIGILIVLLYGTAWLTKHYQIMAMDPDQAGLSEPSEPAGDGRFWARVVLFPDHGKRVAGAGSEREHRFCGFPPPDPGDRLARLPAACLHPERTAPAVLPRHLRADRPDGSDFDPVQGVTDRLIPLYAIGAFLAFTLSQAGMVVHWKKQEGEHKGRTWHMLVNGTGAVATGITTLVVLASKFMSGAWVTALLVPTLILLMYSVKKHYTRH